MDIFSSADRIVALERSIHYGNFYVSKSQKGMIWMVKSIEKSFIDMKNVAFL